jgi:hypothetical protein
MGKNFGNSNRVRYIRFTRFAKLTFVGITRYNKCARNLIRIYRGMIFLESTDYWRYQSVH